jgi:hypothetical protein
MRNCTITQTTFPGHRHQLPQTLLLPRWEELMVHSLQPVAPMALTPTSFQKEPFMPLPNRQWSSQLQQIQVTQLDVTSLSVDARHNNKGPVTWRLAYSTDGGATWVDNGADYNVGAISCGTSTTLSWDMADFSTYNTLYVRVYAYAALSNLNGVATAKNVVLGGSVSFADVDGDGYTSDVDCNDADAAINPGASESCNGIDDNCDGNIDEGVQTTYYADMDGDTYGDAGNTTMACSMPEGYVADATDCNDADAAVNPAATEVCNGIDDNCDGNNDEGLTFTTYYADADGDTYGDAGSTVSTCDGAPEGYVSDATDCNDADGAVNPGATEICNGIDDNCDGNIDEGVQNTYYADMDGDSYGDAGSTTMACSTPEGYVSDATDCNDADGAVNPGATEVCNGIDDKLRWQYRRRALKIHIMLMRMATLMVMQVQQQWHVQLLKDTYQMQPIVTMQMVP